METSQNRFIDGEDDGIKAYDIKQLKDNCDKWSLASDLGLLSHLKQFSNDLINKSETTNQSINSLVYETKIRCVKVSNVINDFQMLANSQFVENRVYDEEMEDIITSGQNAITADENVGNKSKDEEIVPKIKSALNIGLNFLTERFDNISKEVPQTDSDDEEDQILEGLISHNTKDEFSQRLLPYIIGSEEFLRDNYVGLGCVEESPAIDLKTKEDNNVNIISANNIDGDESNFNNTLPVRNISRGNTFVDDMNDSEEESGDIFGGIPDRVNTTQNNVTQDLSDESDSNKFSDNEHNDNDSYSPKDNKIESKPITSFHDELSAAITGKKKTTLDETNSVNQINSKIVSKKVEKMPISLHSDSSDDESESIFKIPKTKPKVETKAKSNFSDLFSSETNNTSLFDDINQTASQHILPNESSRKVSVLASNLFDDEDDEEEDDLFVGTFSKKTTPVVRQTAKEAFVEKSNTYNMPKDKPKDKPKNKPKDEPKNKPKDEPKNKPKDVPKVMAKDIPKKNDSLVRKESLFEDDDEDDDLFSGISIKTNKTIVQNVSAPKPETKPIGKPSIERKANSHLIGELSLALKKKNLYLSDDEENDSSNEDKVANNVKTNISLPNESLFDESNSKKVANSLFSDDITLFSDTTEDSNISNKNNLKSSEVTTNEIKPVKNESKETITESTVAEDDFDSVKSTDVLSNDNLKHRAILGSKRNRRPPSKKVLKLQPITDFSGNSESISNSPAITNEEKSPPIASIRNKKPQLKPISNSIPVSQNALIDDSLKPDRKSIASLVTSPSTEEEDIFPSHTNNFTNQTISRVSNESNTRSSNLFDEYEGNEDSLFTSNTIKNSQITTKSIDKSGLFDTSDSDDEHLDPNPISSRTHFDSNTFDANRISNIIKTSDKDLFNTSSSTDSSLSNKSDVKIEASKPALNLFSDSDDEDLFSVVAKSKSITKVNKTDLQKEIKTDNEHKPNKKVTNLNSLFSESEDEKSDLFKKTNEIKNTKTETNVNKPLFDIEDDDEDDIFAPKPKVKAINTRNSSQKKAKTESESDDLFDDPLFVSHS